MQSINKIIKVGIVLPDDKISNIYIDIPNPVKYQNNNGQPSKKLFIKSESSSIILNDNKINEIDIIPNDDINSDEYLTISSVPTGRGFHWQNTIDVQLPGKIIIQNINGFISILNELDIEEYLPFVATSEMSSKCPIALLEAQTIAARSWLLANRNVNHPDLNIDVCNDDCCQRYQGIVGVPTKSLEAIQNTFGKVLMYGTYVCDARYSKCCGGITDSYENVWGGEPISYLSSVHDAPNPIQFESIKNYISNSPAVFCSPQFILEKEIIKYIGNIDKAGSYFRWKISYDNNELTSIINTKLKLDAKSIINIIPLKRGYSGRIIKLRIDYVDNNKIEKSISLKSEYDIRNTLHNKFLYSSAFLIETVQTNRQIEKFKLLGAGWGHGVGMCQIGALGMALDGYSSEEILKHYFKNTHIEKFY